MHIAAIIILCLGLLSAGLGAACWFSPEDNVENVAMAHFVALPFFAFGALLLLIAFILQVLR